MPTLEFKGKSLVYAHHLTVPVRPLDIDAKKSLPAKGKKPALDDNLIIHGDNLHALRALMPIYAGKVNCIYIDPPYNTGNEGWAYNDNVNSPMMKEWLAQEVGTDDLERHDKWLCMMWPRLHLLRELLAEDGVIFISIDDNEQHRLRMLMDEIFGEKSFIGNVAWKKATGDNKPAFAFTHDNILIYGKEENVFQRQPLTESQKKQYANPDNDPRGDWAPSDYRSKWTKEERKNLYYAITNPNTGEKIYPDTHTDSKRVWGMSPEIHAQNESSELVWWGKDGKSKEPKKKRFLSEHAGTNTRSVWLDAGMNDEGSEMLRMIFSNVDKVFDNAKPISLIKRIVKLIPKSDAIILDSFAGSGTTAHAVMALNKEDGGNRKFILVECEKYADKITAERIRRVIRGIPKVKDADLKKGLGGSFTYCVLGKELSIEDMLRGKNLPTYEAFARYLLYTATGRAPAKITKTKDKDGFFYETNDRLFYLIYEPKLAFLRSSESALDIDRAERIAKQAKKKKKQAVVYATHKFIGQKTLTAMGIAFCGLPYDVL